MLLSQGNGLELEKNGLQMSREYYDKIGKPVLEGIFSEYVNQIAVGLVGEGSECYGYDDWISTDHDYEVSFCVWLPRNVYRKIGEEMNQVYDALPTEYGYVASKIHRREAEERRGVLEIETFYSKFLGMEKLPDTLMEWMAIPETYLAVATNGEVFEDHLGEFTKIRNVLLGYYPEDVRLKKIAACALTMAHAGQCNYSRMMRRHDWAAAFFALNEFIRAAISMVFLLNKKYTPYYKWMWRKMEDLEKLQTIRNLIKDIIVIGPNRGSWYTDSWDVYQQRLNKNEKTVLLIEEICTLVIEELQIQGISSSTSDYLEEHAYAARHRIQDETLRNLPVLESERRRI